VLNVDSTFGLNTTHTPPVAGALGEIGLYQQGQPEKEVHYWNNSPYTSPIGE